MNLIKANERFQSVVTNQLRAVFSENTIANVFEFMRVVSATKEEIKIGCVWPEEYAETYGDIIKALLSGGRIEFVNEYEYEVIPGDKDIKVVFTNED